MLDKKLSSALTVGMIFTKTVDGTDCQVTRVTDMVFDFSDNGTHRTGVDIAFFRNWIRKGIVKVKQRRQK